MHCRKLTIGHIPALLWGKPSEKIYIHVHGKMSRKEYAEAFAAIAERKGYQTLSFDLPRHGERAQENTPCDVQNGIRDLLSVSDYVFSRWKDVSLYACSLGAYFSLQAYGDLPFRKCLFQSPIADMEYLVAQMMLWFDITEEQLFSQQVIETPIDTMTWDYYRFIKSHPILRWEIPTAILYGRLDDLQSPEVMGLFAQKHRCALTVSERSRHPFMEPQDQKIVTDWLESHI